MKRAAADAIWDAVVIGAGVAGAASAAWITRLVPGARVLVVERCAWPREKVCGCCMNPAGVGMLADLGVGLDGQAVDRAVITTPIAAAHVAHPGGAVISRAVLDAALVSRAVEEGARFEPGCSARILGREGTLWSVQLRATGAERIEQARHVVVADGLGGSALADLNDTRFAPVVHPGSRMGIGCFVRTRHPDPGVVRMHIARHGYVGLVDLDETRVCLAAALDPAWTRSMGGPAPAITEILRACRTDPPELAGASMRGTPLLTRRRTRLAAAGLFIIGDAARYEEPFTGEGMTSALAAARALGPIIAASITDAGEQRTSQASAEWHATHTACLRRRMRFARAICAVVHSPGAASVAVNAISTAPWIHRCAESGLARISRSYSLASNPNQPRIRSGGVS